MNMMAVILFLAGSGGATNCVVENANIRGTTTSLTQKGDISYYFKGDDEYNSGYLIDHKFYSGNGGEDSIVINTYLYIEDGKLVVGENVYNVDFTGVLPKLKLDRLSRCVSEENNNLILGTINGYECTAVTDSDGNVFITNYKVKDWERVSKFTIQKSANPKIDVEDVMYGGYRHFVTYAGEDYYARDVYDDETGEYLGYGMKINGTFYELKQNYGNDELYDKYHDMSYEASLIYIQETDENILVHTIIFFIIFTINISYY